MANIIDYAKNNKSLTTQQPFNEIDGLILSQLSYIKWDGIVPGIKSNDSITLHEAITLLMDDEEKYGDLNDNDKNLLNAIVDNPRYSNMVMSNYDAKKTYKSQAETPEDIEQFAAVTFTFDDASSGKKQNFVAYRGTDCSLEGWNEDFNMAYDSETLAQSDSAAYLNTVADKLDGDLRLGGHSKGGNSSNYAFLFCDERVRDRIVKLYSYDAPGYIVDVTRNKNYKKMLELLDGTAIAPYDSVIGLLLDENGYIYVDTNEGIFLDHDPYTWQIDVEKSSFVEREQSFLSKYIDKGFDNLIGLLPKKGRELLINAIWDFIYTTDCENFEDVLEYFGERKLKLFLDVWNADISLKDKIIIYSAFVVIIVVGIGTLIEVAIEEFINWAVEKLTELKEYIEEKFEEFVDWASEKIQAFMDGINEAFTKAKNYIKDIYNRYLNRGYKYANEHPQITVDTYKLTSYSQRLSSVNSRVSSLDRRLDSLYWKVGLLDLWNLMQADLLTGYSWRLNRCIDYLNDTATEFNNVESDLIEKLQ